MTMDKDIRMTIAITGHRPQSIDNDFYYVSETWDWIRNELTATFRKINPQRVITGMALGVDTVAAETALALEIPYTAAVPFPGQESKWSPEQQAHYSHLLQWADQVEFVDDGPYHPGLMQKRNEWMVDRADIVVAVWNGFKGGTRNCVEYALRNQVPVWRIDPKTRKQGRYDGTQHIVRESVSA